MKEAINAAAFRDNSPLGHEYMPSDLRCVNRDVLVKFHQKHFNTDNVVVAGVGISHDKLVNYAESAFANLAKGNFCQPTPSP